MEDIYKFVVDDETFEKIVNGKKNVQIAINTPKRKSYAIGNKLTFVGSENSENKPAGEESKPKSVDATIENLLYFADIREAVETLGKEKCGFKPSQSFEKASDIFLSQETYESVQKNGLVAIVFKLS